MASSSVSETGVSQQANYFKAEADDHEKASESWRQRTVRVAWILGIYDVANPFIAKIPLPEPSDTYQSIQLGVSKILIFMVISFMLYFSAQKTPRSFLRHHIQKNRGRRCVADDNALPAVPRAIC